MMTIRNRTMALCIATSSLLLCGNSLVPPAGRAQTPAVLELTPGTCPVLVEDQIVSLLWNPAFDHSSFVTGISNFHLGFATEAERPSLARHPPSLVLIASPRQHGQEPGDPASEIQPAPNGFYRLLFQVHLGYAVPGEYRLVTAQADAATAPGYNGPVPQMSNSPAAQSFCVTVPATARRR